MTFHPSVNITEQIADHLADLVVQNELVGGTRIQELKIARELGVSRGSVRESLLILERRHLIEIVPRRGAVVNELLADDAIELTETLVANERRLLHKLVARRHIDRILDAALDAVERMEGAAREEDTKAAVDGQLTFFAALLLDSSRYTRAVYDCLLPTSQRVIYYLIGHSNIDLHDVARFYRALHTALAERDCERIDELLTGYQHRLTRLTHDAFGTVQSDKGRGAGNGRRAAGVAAGS